MNIDQRLVAFFYLLMRNHLPCGAVVDIIKEIETIDQEIVFTNKNLEAMAKDYLGRLTGEIKQKNEKE